LGHYPIIEKIGAGGPDLHREFELMSEAGLTPMQILVDATQNAAKVYSPEPDIGVVQPGKYADPLVLPGKSRLAIVLGKQWFCYRHWRLVWAQRRFRCVRRDFAAFLDSESQVGRHCAPLEKIQRRLPPRKHGG